MEIDTNTTRSSSRTPSSFKPTREGQKRALPARHSFLTEAVQYAMEKRSMLWEPHIDTDSIICITDANGLVDCEERPTDTVMEDAPDPRKDLPGYVIRNHLPQRYRNPRTGVGMTPLSEVEVPSEDFYLKRHRKHEVEEKKQKNREKEKLIHEMYQQQQFVERVRHTDKSIIITIAKNLLQQEEVTIDADALHRDILHEAEEQLERYEMLGLSRRPRQNHTVRHDRPEPSSTTELESSSAAPVAKSSPSHSPPTALTTPKCKAQPAKATQPTKGTQSEKVSHSTKTTQSTKATQSTKTSQTIKTLHSTKTSQPTKATQQAKAAKTAETAQPEKVMQSENTTEQTALLEQPAQQVQPAQTKPATQPASSPKASSHTISTKPPFKTFKTNPDPHTPKGSRRSGRHVLAFGRKIPPMKEHDFHLPYDPFGPLMDQRINKAKECTGQTSPQ